MSDNFVPLDTFRIESITMYRPGIPEDERIDIKAFVFELGYFEDMFSGTVAAHLVLSDPINLPESFPIVGGEYVDIRFRSPQYVDSQLLTFVVGNIGDRIQQDQTNKQEYILPLVTLDRYRDLKKDISKSYTGTYDSIVEQLLKDLGSTTSLTKDEANYNQTFVCPYWSPLKACEWIASRAQGVKVDPFFFWETMDGYQFRSAHNIFSQPAYAKLKLEPSRHKETNEGAWRRVIKFENKKSVNRLRELQDGAYGVHVTLLNTETRRIEKQEYDYKTLSGSPDFAKLEKFPLYPEDKEIFKNRFFYSKMDKSHEGRIYREMVMSTIDHYRVKVTVPGDSGYRAGQVLDFDIPDLSVSDTKTESMTSGRWLIVSLMHLIRHDTFTTSMELCKNSHAVDVVGIIGEIDESGNVTESRATTTDVGSPTVDKPAAPRIPPAD